MAICLHSCQEAELPMANFAKVDISATWENYGFSLSANVEKSNDVTILEKGFVIQPNILGVEPLNYVLNSSDEFKANLEVNWGNNVQCNVYAYVKTTVGDFRSIIIDYITGDTHSPIITSVTMIPDETSFIGFSGKLVIEGKYFSTVLKDNKVWIGDYENNVIEASMNKLVVKYNWSMTGTFPIRVEVNSKMSIDKSFVEFKGQEFVSHTPLNPCYGGVVDFTMKNLDPDGDYKLQMQDYYGNWQDVTIKIINRLNNSLQIRMYPVYFLAHEPQSNKLKIRLYEINKHVYSPTYEIEMASMWKTYMDKLLGTFYTRYTIQGSKVYLYDYDGCRLQCFDVTTQKWDFINNPISEFKNGDSTGTTIAVGNYVYVSYGLHNYDTSTGISTYTPCYYRYDIINEQWSVMPNMGEAIGIKPMFVEGDDDILYILEEGSLYKYIPENNEKELLYSNIPSDVNLTGFYDGDFYYNDATSLYRINDGTSQLLYDFSKDNPNRLFMNHDYTYCRIIGKYAYLKEQKGVFRIDISQNNPMLEPLGWVYDDDTMYNNNLYIWPLGEELLVLSHGFYEGMLYKYIE